MRSLLEWLGVVGNREHFIMVMILIVILLSLKKVIFGKAFSRKEQLGRVVVFL